MNNRIAKDSTVGKMDSPNSHPAFPQNSKYIDTPSNTLNSELNAVHRADQLLLDQFSLNDVNETTEDEFRTGTFDPRKKKYSIEKDLNLIENDSQSVQNSQNVKSSSVKIASPTRISTGHSILRFFSSSALTNSMNRSAKENQSNSKVESTEQKLKTIETTNSLPRSSPTSANHPIIEENQPTPSNLDEAKDSKKRCFCL